jgi:hypothetical protein
LPVRLGRVDLGCAHQLGDSIEDGNALAAATHRDRLSIRAGPRTQDPHGAAIAQYVCTLPMRGGHRYQEDQALKDESERAKRRFGNASAVI